MVSHDFRLKKVLFTNNKKTDNKMLLQLNPSERQLHKDIISYWTKFKSSESNH